MKRFIGILVTLAALAAGVTAEAMPLGLRTTVWAISSAQRHAEQEPGPDPVVTNTVVFEANGGSGSMVAQKFKEGVAQSLSPNEFTLAGYAFTGWATNSAGPVVYSDGQSITVASDMTLYAQWTEDGGGATPYGTPIFTIVDEVLTAVDLNGATNVTIPNNVRVIGARAFYECTGLRSVTFPSSVKKIGEYAFYRCSGLVSVTIPASVEVIGRYAFAQCDNLSECSVDGGILDWCVFVRCPKLSKATIGAEVTAVGADCFAFCDSLTNVTFAEGTVDLALQCPFGCTPLTELHLPARWNDRLGENPFGDCLCLTNVTISSGNSSFAVTNGLLVSSDFKTVLGAFGSLVDIEFPDCVETIEYRALECLPNVEEIIFPDTILELRGQSIYQCNALKTIRFGKGIVCLESTQLGDPLISTCPDLKAVYFYGNAPTNDTQYIYQSVADDLVTYVTYDSTGWGGVIPGMWNGRRIEYFEEGDVPPGPPVTTWTVTFDPNGGSLGTADNTMLVEDGAFGDRTLPKPTRAGYVFLGWFTAASGGTQVTAETIVTGDVTYYAHWKANGPVVTFNANGGSVTEASRVVKKNAAIGTLPKPTRTGYTFNGWYTKTSGGTKIKTTTKVTKDVTYYAQWTANKYTIKFNANGGKGTMKSLSATYGKNVTLTANAFKRTNWTFLGWATKKDATEATCANKAKVKNLSSKSGGTVTLYAVWKQNTYTVKFSANGGTGSMAKQTLGCGSSVKLDKNTYTREGFKFAGWATKKGGKVEYKNKAKVKDLAKSGKSVTLYAVWYPADWAVGTFKGTGAIGNTNVKKRKAASVTLTVSSTGKISGKFVRKSDKKSFSFKVDAFKEFKDGALWVETTISYGSKKCALGIAVSQTGEAGATVADLLVTYGGKDYGEAALK